MNNALNLNLHVGQSELLDCIAELSILHLGGRLQEIWVLFPCELEKVMGHLRVGLCTNDAMTLPKSVLMISTIIMPETKLLTSCVLVPYTSWDLWVWTVNTIAVCRLQCRERWLARKWLPRFDWSLQWNRISCLRDAQVFHISHKFLHPVWFTEHLKKLQTSW